MTIDTVEDISTKSRVSYVHLVVLSSILTAIVFIRNEEVPKHFSHRAIFRLLFFLHLVQFGSVGIFATSNTSHLICPFHEGLAP